jgi:hypothetical protein
VKGEPHGSFPLSSFGVVVVQEFAELLDFFRFKMTAGNKGGDQRRSLAVAEAVGEVTETLGEKPVAALRGAVHVRQAALVCGDVAFGF